MTLPVAKGIEHGDPSIGEVILLTYLAVQVVLLLVFALPHYV